MSEKEPQTTYRSFITEAFVTQNGNGRETSSQHLHVCSNEAKKSVAGKIWLLLQPTNIGLPTGNEKKLSFSQAQVGQATGLAVA